MSTMRDNVCVAQALLDQPHNTRQMNECREMGDRGRKDLAAESEIRADSRLVFLMLPHPENSFPNRIDTNTAEILRKKRDAG